MSAEVRKNVTVGAVYEYCRDCGATRHRPDVGARKDAEAWHSCDQCRLPGATCGRLTVSGRKA